jgi:hypothetical protein
MKGDDLRAIRAAIDELNRASHKLAETMYATSYEGVDVEDEDFDDSFDENSTTATIRLSHETKCRQGRGPVRACPFSSRTKPCVIITESWRRTESRPDAIRAAYRQLVRQKHPDLAATPADHAGFRGLTEAYRVLADPAARRQYDAKRIFLLAPPIRRLLDAFENPRVRGRLAETLFARRPRAFPAEESSAADRREDILVNKLISFQQSYTGGDIR